MNDLEKHIEETVARNISVSLPVMKAIMKYQYNEGALDAAKKLKEMFGDESDKFVAEILRFYKQAD